MLGFLYLILILGWMLIVIVLKCKKSLSPHLTLAANYPENIDRNPSVHVIQLQPDDFRDSTNSTADYRHRGSIIDERLENQNSFPIDSVINPAYANDEELMIGGLNAPPPSYEEVMRQPEIYPKVKDLKKPNTY